jgi:hypothetical protein
LRFPRDATGFSPVRNFSILAASSSFSMRSRVRLAVTGFSHQIFLSASMMWLFSISCSLRTCRLGTSRIDRSHAFSSFLFFPTHQPG